MTLVYVLLNVVVSVLATWWPPAPIRVSRKHSPIPHHWVGERCRQRRAHRERESCFCPFLDIVDNHNNRDTFQSTFLCVIAWGYVCLSKWACTNRCCVQLPCKVRDKDRVGEKKSTVADSKRSHQRHPLLSNPLFTPVLPPSLSPPGFNKGRLVYRRNITGLLLSVQSSLHTALSYFHLKLHIRQT